MENKKIITIYLDENLAKELEERAIQYKMSVNRLLNIFLKDKILDYFPPKYIIHQHLKVLELYLQDEEKKNNEEIENLKTDLKLIDYTVNNDETKLKKAKLEKRLLDCTNKIKILKAKKESIEIICEKLEYLS